MRGRSPLLPPAVVDVAPVQPRTSISGSVVAATAPGGARKSTMPCRRQFSSSGSSAPGAGGPEWGQIRCMTTALGRRAKSRLMPSSYNLGRRSEVAAGSGARTGLPRRRQLRLRAGLSGHRASSPSRGCWSAYTAPTDERGSRKQYESPGIHSDNGNSNGRNALLAPWAIGVTSMQ